MNVYIKKQNFAWQKVAISAAAVILLIVFLNLFQKQVRNSFFTVFAPVSNIFLESGKNSSNFFGSFLSFNALKSENSNLKTENQNLLASLSSLQEAISSNQDLQAALSNTKDDNFSLKQAKVIGLDIQNDTILINKGSHDGLVENMPVISSSKVLFGRVAKAYPDFAQIILISNKKSALAVKIQNPDPVAPPIYGAVKGSGSLSVYMDLINAGSQINQGDVLVTSAQDGVFPEGLLVGKVESSNANDSKAFQTAKVQPFFDAKNTGSLFVITNYLKK